jgi:hypothetical protein
MNIFPPFYFILNIFLFPNLEMGISRKKVNFYIIGEYNNFKYKKLFIEFLLKIEWIDNKND